MSKLLPITLPIPNAAPHVATLQHERSALLAREHLLENYPLLRDLIAELDIVNLPEPSSIAIHIAITRIVIGQLLSLKAASTISTRVEEQVKKYAVAYSWELSVEVLRSCGVSTKKIRTLQEFGRYFQTNGERVEQWHMLPYEELRKEVTQIWGLADWSVSILAIFHFGHEDVFPTADGSVMRASMLVQKGIFKRRRFNPELCSPYKSYLALYLLRALDQGHLKKYSNKK